MDHRSPTSRPTVRSASHAREHTFAHSVVKRVADVTIASVALLLATPVLVAVWFAVRLTSPGRAVFRQTRIGDDRQPFVMYKFRTMVSDCDDAIHRDYVSRLLEQRAEQVDGLYKIAADPRITRVGAVLRRTSLDELPQLVNVLRGELSLVGPRPALAWEAELFRSWADARFSVKPGLTGLWQVSGRNRLSMVDGLTLDVQYVAECSFRMDVRILLRTVPAVLGSGAR
jgi:lipopolysaccharide/colanic/teichoic acid biosynthesis glycosyltransferase